MTKGSHLSPELQARNVFLQSRTVQQKLAELADRVKWAFFAVLPGTDRRPANSPVNSLQFRKMAISVAATGALGSGLN